MDAAASLLLGSRCPGCGCPAARLCGGCAAVLHGDVDAIVITGGLAYEGLNNVGASGEHMIVLLNDNGMSIDPNVGGLSRHLSRQRPT